MELWQLVTLIRDVKLKFNREVQLELGGINQLTAIFSQKCSHEGVRIQSVTVEGQNLDYNWGHSYLAKPKFTSNGADRIFTGLLYPEVIIFKDCGIPLTPDCLIGLP